MNDLSPNATLDERLRNQVQVHLEQFPRRAMEIGARRAAAVALALVADDQHRPCFLLTRRASDMRNHAGQWALPGGSIDPGEDATGAALRELHEELGLELSHADVLGSLDDYATRSGFVITPVVVWGGARVDLRPNPQEVAAAYRVPVSVLDAPEVPTLRHIPESDRPLISIAMLGTDIHAPTAAILYQLREVALWGRDTRVSHYEQPVFAWK